MPSLVQQSTTQLALKFFLVLSSDHITAATGLSPTVTIRKEGGSFGSPSGTVTEIANGWYQVAGNATDTATLGDILLHATAATADPCDMIAAEVVAFNPQTANLGLSHVSSNVDQWNSHSVTDTTSGVPDVNAKNINNVTAVTQPTNFSSLSITAAGLVATTSNIKKNVASAGFSFLMTDVNTHAAKTGLTVTSMVSIDGGAFSSTANSVVEVANGTYKLDLAAADVNGNHIMLQFTATGADQLNVEIITQP